MDRIDKFLNRRKQKNKRTIKLRDKYFEITKEDIKIVRSYKKNACLDETVDMYRPYSTKFTLDTAEQPLKEYKAIEKSESTLRKEKRNFIKKNKDRVTKQHIPRDINRISDIWEDDNLESLGTTDQNILLDIKDQYEGSVDDLKLEKNMLEKELRRIYLMQYLPRERKQFRVTDIIKEAPKPESLKPYPTDVALHWDFGKGKCVINRDGSLMMKIQENTLEIYESNSVLIFRFSFFERISQAKFGFSNEIYFISNGKLYLIEEKDFSKYAVELNSIEDSEVVGSNDISEFRKYKDIDLVEVSFKAKVKDFDVSFNEIVGCIVGKNLVIINFKDLKSTSLYKVEGGSPHTLMFHKTYTHVLICTSNSVIVYDVHKKAEVINSKLFSYVVTAEFKKDIIYVTNNTGIVYIYDYIRNMILHTMSQEQDILSMDIHQRFNLLSLSTRKELVIFYCDTIKQQFVVVKRICGLQDSLKFHDVCPWLFSRVGGELVMYS